MYMKSIDREGISAYNEIRDRHACLALVKTSSQLQLRFNASGAVLDRLALRVTSARLLAFGSPLSCERRQQLVSAVQRLERGVK
jgi:hypothetical protein